MYNLSIMDGGQNESLVFHSDDISSTQSHRNKDNYFVRVTKNPILRFLLRAKKQEEKPEPEAPKPVVKVPEKPKPQFRATIRISTLKLETLKKTNRKVVVVLSAVVAVLVIVIGGLGYGLYNVLTVKKPATDGEIMSARKEMLALVRQPVMTEELASVVEKMDEQINLVPEGDLRQSLKIYKMFLLMDTKYYAEALNYFQEIENENFTDSQKCELYDYRLKLAAKASADEGDYREKYNTFCMNGQSSEIKNEIEGEENEK